VRSGLFDGIIGERDTVPPAPSPVILCGGIVTGISNSTRWSLVNPLIIIRILEAREWSLAKYNTAFLCHLADQITGNSHPQGMRSLSTHTHKYDQSMCIVRVLYLKTCASNAASCQLPTTSSK